MSKRRTKKEKLAAKHQFAISWQPSTKTSTPQAHVKGQFTNRQVEAGRPGVKEKRADFLDKDSNLSKIKKDIKKSLIIVSLIIGTELVIYLAWNVR